MTTLQCDACCQCQKVRYEAKVGADINVRQGVPSYGRTRPETHGHPVLHDVSPGRSALTTKMTAGVDVTGCLVTR